MCCSRDAEAIDMIHMGSDHRSVVAQFAIAASKKEVPHKTHIENKKIPTAESTSQDGEKMRSGEATMFEERYAELEREIKHEAGTAGYRTEAEND